jgi:selenide,water dikinase
MQTEPIARDLILLGGGHSHVLVLRMLGMKSIPGLQVTLISPDVLTPYSGMLPGFVAGHYSEADIHIDLVPLCKFAGARFIKAAAYDIDPISQLVKCHGRADFKYDLLSIDIGISPAVSDVPGAAEHTIAVKPIAMFLNQWRDFLGRCEKNQVRKVAVVGGGAGGVELCLGIAHRLKTMGLLNTETNFELNLLVDGPNVLPGYDDRARERIVSQFESKRVKLHTGCRVEAISENGEGKKLLQMRSDDQLEVDEIFWVTSAAGQSWLANTGLLMSERGFIAVEPTLQVKNHANIFAVGDIADVTKFPRPKAGVFAVRQGPPLFDNIKRALMGQALKAFEPQATFLSLLATGDKYAVASKHGWSTEGRLVWRWKDWIDRSFMAKFASLPVMKKPTPKGLLAEFDEQMQCGGCGSKVSADLLAEVLEELNIDTSSLDDAAIFEVPKDKVMLHTVDAFKSFVDDPYLFAQIAVNHSLSDIYAMLGKPVTALAILTLPYAKPEQSRALLTQVMAGIISRLNEEGVKLIGGHTSEGAELSIGFAVNGIIDKPVNESSLLDNTETEGGSKKAQAPGLKRGAKVGDILVLTKPIGTGTLFAADMQYKAKGQWIQSAIDMMLTSNKAAADILCNANACTDVTGFGLAGHLMEMLKADQLEAEITLDQLPLLDGALATINTLGIRSTLHEANQRSVSLVEGNIEHPAFPLLFDPQTAGGLLAAVNAEEAEELLLQLRASSCSTAAIIGRITSQGVTSAERGGTAKIVAS